MTEEEKEKTEKDPVGGTGEKKEESKPFRSFATEDEFKAYETKRVEVYERKLAGLRKEMDDVKSLTQTEAEKAAELERKKAEIEGKKIVEAAERRAELKAVLMSKGLNREYAGILVKEVPDDWTDPEEAVKTLDARLKLQLESKRAVGGGGGRNAEGSEVLYTPEYVQEMLTKHGPQWYTPEIRKKAEAYRAAHYGKGARRIGAPT